MGFRANEKTHIVPRKRGRPSGFTEDHPEQAFRLALLGATDEEMAEFWGITVQTLNVWKKTAPGFLAALLRGKHDADARVAESLFKRATGYSHETVKIFNADGAPLIVPYTEKYPPDVAAATKWLELRARGKWQPKNSDVTVNINMDMRQMPEEAIRAQIAAMAARIGGGVTDVEDEAEDD